MSAAMLPAWAEDVLRHLGPVAAFGQAEADADAVARHDAITSRFRARWLELAPVWKAVKHDQRKCEALLYVMVDAARYGSRDRMARLRTALADMERLDEAIRAMVDDLQLKLSAYRETARLYELEPGIDPPVTDALDRAARQVALQNWRQARPLHSDFAEAINPRDSRRDALRVMLTAIDAAGPILGKSRVTNSALSAMFNVAHDATEHEALSEDAAKVARWEMGRR